MADENKQGSIKLGDAVVHFTAEGTEIVAAEMGRVKNEAKKLASALNSIARGNDIDKYWNKHASTLKGVAEAYEQFNYYQSENNASALVKSFNSFVASGGNVSDLIERFGDGFEGVVERAQRAVPAISEAFSVDNLRDSFSAFNTFVNEYGVDLQNTFKRLGEAASVEDLRSTIDDLNNQVQRYRRIIRELESGDSNQKANAFDELVKKQRQEFANFVNANDVPKNGWGNKWSVDEVNRYFDAVSNGAMTSKEAIARFKAEMPHLLSSDMSSGGGELDGGALAAFSAKVEGILTKLGELREQLTQTSTKVDEVKELIGSIGSVGPGSGIGSTGNAVGNIDALTSAIQRFADVIEQIIPVIEKFQGLNLNLSLGGNKNQIQKNAEFGIASRQSLSELKERVGALREFLGEMVGASDEFQLLNKMTSGTGIKFDIFEILEGINGSGSYDQQLKAFRDYINIIQKAAEIKGIDISGVTSQFGKSADEMIEDTQKVLSGEKDMETALTGLRNIFGGGGGGGNPPFDPTPLLDSIERLITSLDDLKRTADTLGDDMFTRLGDKLKGIDTGGISDLLSILAQYLPQISQVDVSKIQALADIDWGNWTSFDVKPGSLEQFQSLLEKIGNTQVAIFNTGDQQYSSKQLEEGTARYARALSAVDKALVSARENSRKWTAAQTGESSGAYRKLLASISALEKLRDNLDNYSGSAFREELDKINADINEAINTMSAKNERFNADAMKKDSVEYINALTQISNAIKGVESQSDRYKNIFAGTEVGSVEIENLTNLTEKLRALKEEVESDGGMSKDSFRERFAEIKKEASELNEVLARLAREQQGTLVQGTKGYNDALTKLNSMLIQVAENSEKWEASRNGRTSANYEEYIAQGEAIRQLMSDIQAGNVTQKEFQERSAEIARTMKENEAAIRAEGEAVKSLGSSFQGVLGILLRYFSLTRIMMAGINKAKEMVNTSMDIESAMTRIQIVTSSTDAQMEHFFEATAAQAKSLGKNLTDVAGSIETFSRLGYSISDASELSKYATIMSNVADVDVGAATTGITSIIKGFDMKASDAEHVSDVLVQVGQKYAISAEELMEAFERGGAALNASGTSFEKSAALFAATNASLQNASTTGTLWKTNILSLHTEMCA